MFDRFPPSTLDRGKSQRPAARAQVESGRARLGPGAEAVGGKGKLIGLGAGATWNADGLIGVGGSVRARMYPANFGASAEFVTRTPS